MAALTKLSSLTLGEVCLRQKSRMWLCLTVQVAVICLFFSLSTRAEAASFTFTKIADNNTSIPGGTGNFGSFNSPSINNGNVGFSGDGEQVQGIYTYTGGSLNVVADTNTLIPGGTEFTFLPDSPALSDGSVAFRGYGSSFEQQGIYTNIGGSLNVVADTSTPIPDETGKNFFAFIEPSLDGENVAFSAIGPIEPEQRRGIYSNIGGSLNVVVDTNTPIPGGTGNFTSFISPELEDGNVAFVGEDSFEQQGIYTNIEGSLNVVADTNTPVPSETGNFSGLRSPALDSGNVAFFGSGNQEGIYTNMGGSLNAVADTNTLIPGGIGNFIGFESFPALDNGNVAFLGLGSDSQSGIYSNIGGSLSKVIDLNDSLDGETLSFIDFSPEGLSGNQIAFRAGFGNNEGIFIATLIPEPSPVPEPSSALGVLALSALGAGSLLKRWH